MTEKIINFSEIVFSASDTEFDRSTVCFGHFNTIHPGHIRYFRIARKYGRKLVVAVEGDVHLPNSGRAGIFSEEDRAQSVGSIDLVDFVVILDQGSLEDLVRQINLSALVLGKEFEEARSEKVKTAVVAARSKGAQVIYDAGETHYATSELLSNTATELEEERWDAFIAAQKAQNISLPRVFSIMKGAAMPRILVIGDTIVDRYVACDPVGMSSEAPVVVVKEMDSHDYLGGAGIVAAHVSRLGAHCTYLSVVGKDDGGRFATITLPEFGVDSILFEDDSRPTTLKVRYMVENQKLFRVSRLNENNISRSIEKKIIREIISRAPSLDGILVSDFVYGVVTPKILEVIKTVAKKNELLLFGDLQCSSQIGNVLRFEDFFLLCPTEREARIALANHNDGLEYLANLLIKETRSTNMILKLGGDGFIAYYESQQEKEFSRRQYFPALTANAIDVAGAGDALIATMAVGLTQGLSMLEVSAVACCVSAIAVQTVGNRPIDLNQVERFFFKHSKRRGK
jgi:rfaE bifunctional protein kinase chain/domain